MNCLLHNNIFSSVSLKSIIVVTSSKAKLQFSPCPQRPTRRNTIDKAPLDMFKAVRIMASTSSSYTLSNRLIKPPLPLLAPFLLSSSRTGSSSPRPPPSSRTNNGTRPFLIPRMCSTRSDPHSHVASHSNVAARDLGNPRKINFCQWCGGATKHEVPDGEEKMRAICTLCGRIAYQNPKMVTHFFSEPC
ncbi:Nudix hydrolase 23, chloroplastic-like protein [Drosera capensis]